MAIVVEELVSKLGLEIDSGAMATLEKFRSAVAGGMAGLAAAGAAVAGAFVGIVANAAHAADNIGDMAEKLGVGAQALQELRVAAELSDVSFEALSTGLKFLSKNAAEAAHGSKEAIEAFSGVKLRDANGQLKTADVLLGDVADRFLTIKDPAEQTRLAMKVFGRSGLDLVPMLKRGSEGINAFRKEAQELGVVFGEDALKASDDFGREMVRVKFAMEGLRNTFAVPFFQLFVEGVKLLVGFLKRLQPAVLALSKAFADVGQRLGRLAGTAKRVWDSFNLLDGDSLLGRILSNVDGLKLLEAAIVGFGVIAVGVAAATLASWVLAAAPFILLAVLIGVIVDELNTFITGGDSALGMLIKWAEAVDPSDHPIIVFLKSALALLFDLTDPAHWERFKNAAINAAKAVSEHIRLALGGKKFSKRSDGALVEEGAGTSQPEQGGIFGQGGLLDTLGLKRGGFENLQAQGLVNPLSTGGASSPDAAAAISSQPRKNFSGGLQQTNHIEVNASGMSVDQATTVVHEVIQKQNREALSTQPPGQ